MVGDTSRVVAEEMARRIRGLSPEDRFRKGARMFSAGKRFAEIAVKQRGKELHGVDLQLAVFRWMYHGTLGANIMDRVEAETRKRFQRESKRD